MKKILPAFLLVILLSCAKDFSKIKKGMPLKEVVDIVGKPKTESKMFNAKFYYYKDYVLIFEKDTLSSIKSAEDFEKALENF